jgi:alanyl-tRNA synthetase
MLGVHEPFLYHLAGFVADQMGDVFAELVAHREYAARVIRTEEEKFSTTLWLPGGPAAGHRRGEGLAT